jgi:phenylpyruvate tautomerase PptA (4-oxalocrotonate tautomerase family)
VPLIEVRLFDRRVNPETSARIIEKLTDALADACQDEGVKQHTQVIVEGVSPQNWGQVGKPMG